MDGISSSDEDGDSLSTTLETPTPQPPNSIVSSPLPRASSKGKENTCLRFKCPPSFVEHSVGAGGLCLENVGDDQELWLIRVPRNFDCDAAGDIEVNLRETSSFTRGDQNYQAIPSVLSQSRVKNNTTVWLADKEGKMCSAPPFHGHVTVMEVPSTPCRSVQPTSPPSPRNHLPSGMIPRYKPFGCDGVKRRRKEKQGTDLNDSPPKKKKKKRRHHQTLDSTADISGDITTTENHHTVAMTEQQVEDYPALGAEIVSKKKKKKSKKDKR